MILSTPLELNEMAGIAAIALALIPAW